MRVAIVHSAIDGRPCETHVLAYPVRIEHDALVAHAMVTGAGALAPLPAPVVDALDAYRARFSAGAPPPFAAGVHRWRLPGLPIVAARFGFAYVTVPASEHLGAPVVDDDTIYVPDGTIFGI